MTWWKMEKNLLANIVVCFRLVVIVLIAKLGSQQQRRITQLDSLIGLERQTQKDLFPALIDLPQKKFTFIFIFNQRMGILNDQSSSLLGFYYSLPGISTHMRESTLQLIIASKQQKIQITAKVFFFAQSYRPDPYVLLIIFLFTRDLVSSAQKMAYRAVSSYLVCHYVLKLKIRLRFV